MSDCIECGTDANFFCDCDCVAQCETHWCKWQCGLPDMNESFQIANGQSDEQMNNYTKGPWSFIENIDGANHGARVVGEGRVVAECSCLSQETNKANAKLIAAAPALLEFAEHALNFSLPANREGPEYFPPGGNEWREFRRRARAALKKAQEG